MNALEILYYRFLTWYWRCRLRLAKPEYINGWINKIDYQLTSYGFCRQSDGSRVLYSLFLGTQTVHIQITDQRAEGQPSASENE